MASRIIGCGGYLPEKILTNEDLSKLVDTSDEWIKSRTGISQRHIAGNSEFASHMAFKAADAAIKDAGIDKNEIDLIIVSTNTADNSFPSVANKLQGYLGIKEIPSFDLQAICSGFIYGLNVADAMLKSGNYNTILLVCSEKMSSLLDWEDRSSCILFGDGSGAVIIKNEQNKFGIIDSKIYSNGSFADLLYTDGGISSTQKSGKIKMNGQEVFKKAVEKMHDSVNELLDSNNIKLEDIDYFIPHQANIRIINTLLKKLNCNNDKVVVTIDKHANCSAASIPLALSALKKDVIIREGALVLFVAFGAGFTWGAAILRW